MGMQFGFSGEPGRAIKGEIIRIIASIIQNCPYK